MSPRTRTGRHPARGNRFVWDAVLQGRIDPAVPRTAEGALNSRSLLFVRHRIVKGVLGEAALRSAIVSLAGTPSVAGHELGHLLGARHAYVAKREVAFFRVCATFMHEVDGAYPSCNDYSVDNVRSIRRKMVYGGSW